MKSFSLLPLAAIAAALVIPDAETAQSLRLQLQDSKPQSIWDSLPSADQIWADAEERVEQVVGCAKHKVENVVDTVYETTVKYDNQFRTAFAGDEWLASKQDKKSPEDHPPHHGPPHDGPPHHGPPDHHGPHHPHHGPPNQTVYQLIAESKYTTRLAKLINEYPDLVEMLNGTKANFTVFAPTDQAFEKIPKHAPKPSKEQLKHILSYHVSPEFYPAGRVLVTRTIPTALGAEFIHAPQRLSTQVSFRGLTVNFYARIIAVNIFGTNGVIHGIDSILLPPPKVADIITSFPGEFSTLELALYKTGLFPAFNDTKTHHGGTLFAPSNFAFQKLGPRINAFLFSEHGLKYLKALIEYHGAPDVTLYSDAIYKHKEDSESFPDHRIPKGIYHIDLETGLKGKSLSVDIARYGRLIEIKINGFNRVAVSDGIAADGVIHVVNSVLIPPKEPGMVSLEADDTLTVEELKAALAPFVDQIEEGKSGWEL
ncbi:hypothetical protein LTS08_007351 [Lithohypha guttulata]|uniref:FAS1 domain-containing protein n=1 Tax=Lithohypha guttulata TaxID=1690604 RepID=A0AAN7T8Z9_9EURO|nr:hypothetical protein LTR51_002188 [Lithohypha guttulata]KAK5090086.1 hypothetical protein LTR05_000255 [Lithohypha guttulata]KAK5096861.1 hypothetical protein LTS08_007351 [Lithohypha guttulata]